MCSPTRQTHIPSVMLFSHPGTIPSNKNKCSSTWNTHTSPTWETHIPSGMCFPHQEQFLVICSSMWEPQITGNMYYPTPETHSIREMCMPTRKSHFPNETCMCCPTQETHIPSDMCFLDKRTHITSDICFGAGRTHITGKHISLWCHSNMCYP